ncbi:hypothetical protein OJF2_77860 [Aquisphaera giovannonii]|uniref:Uncharacterized protein n=1 Tax=Aquisphaera giovannonii TaxID=406548 RepID=A0A5B9WG54_9BACT|nr:hypothetical protein [Aquisphaera giovannonii]QEH39174.1 hypothetical protein OJF2_77860 [Aquisphaera giovannonii]
MPEPEIDRSRLGALADAAFRRAARQVVRRARQFGTPILLWRDGEVLEFSPDEIELPPEESPEVEDAGRPGRDRGGC